MPAIRERSLTPREVTAVTKRRRAGKARASETPAKPPAEVQVEPAPALAPGIAALLAAYAEEEPIELAATTGAPRRAFAERARAREGSAELLVFRVGREWFGLELGAVEEAVERPLPQAVPDAPPGVLGVFPLRGRSVATYAPDSPLGAALAGDEPVALVIGSGGTRIALLVDLVEDVMHTPLDALRDAPGIDDADGVLLGVLWRGGDLVAVLDATALVARCTRGHTIAAA